VIVVEKYDVSKLSAQVLEGIGLELAVWQFYGCHLIL